MLALGDTQYHVGALEDFNSVFDQTWGRVKPIIRPVVGNHEYSTSNAHGYFDYFNGVGKHNGPAGERDKGYYSFDIGSWHLIALNSQCDQVAHGGALNGCAPGSPQERWLQSDLAAHRTSCTLAYWHSPRFNSGFRGNSPAGQPFWDVLHAAGADIVLSGDATLRALRAAGPERGTRPRARHPRLRRRHGRRVLHRLEQAQAEQRSARQRHLRRARADAARDQLRWHFLPEPGGTFTDAGSGACHGRTPGFTPSKPPAPVRSVTKKTCTIRGTREDDRLIGTAKKDVICALAGKDTVRGLGGNDVIRGGPGRDRLYEARGTTASTATPASTCSAASAAATASSAGPGATASTAAVATIRSPGGTPGGSTGCPVAAAATARRSTGATAPARSSGSRGVRNRPYSYPSASRWGLKRCSARSC